ncbi:androgen-induced gene 1 protein [Dendroctonus ponderosae]
MGISTVVHLIIAGHFWFGCYYNWFHVNVPLEVSDLGDAKFRTKQLKFLTYWDALLQSIFFTICVLNDFIGSNERFPKKRPLIRKIKDFVLPALAFPVSMFVSVTFWGLYAVDRELILPKALDPYFPGWLNHLVHTNVIIFSFFELIWSYRKYPSRKVGLSVLCAFMLTYLVWMHYIHFCTNKWVYRVLTVLDLPGRIAFFIGNLSFAVAMYILGEKINNIRWGHITKAKAHKK